MTCPICDLWLALDVAQERAASIIHVIAHLYENGKPRTRRTK